MEEIRMGKSLTLSKMLKAIEREFADLSRESDKIAEWLEAEDDNLLCISHWESAGCWWQVCSIPNTEKELKNTAWGMASATDRDTVYGIVLVDKRGNVYDLDYEIEIVSVNLEKR
jgi:hypothetical protein